MHWRALIALIALSCVAAEDGVCGAEDQFCSSEAALIELREALSAAQRAVDSLQRVVDKHSALLGSDAEQYQLQQRRDSSPAVQQRTGGPLQEAYCAPAES